MKMCENVYKNFLMEWHVADPYILISSWINLNNRSGANDAWYVIKSNFNFLKIELKNSFYNVIRVENWIEDKEIK